MPKILVIEDDSALRQMVVRALREDGYEVLEAENGAVGTQMARTHLPDLVLCDIRMDKLDGYGTLAALRDDSATKTIPFILMTGQADYSGMRHGMELGADDYLPKPFTIPALRAAVRTRLSKHDTLQQEAYKRLAALRANISGALPHELRTPLNGILGFSEIIARECASLPAEEIASMAVAINESARRLHHTIENALLFAQLELARTDETRALAMREGETIDVAEVVRKIATERAHNADRESDLSLELTRCGAAIREDRLARIVGEVVDNAFKFSSANSVVRVSLDVVENRVVFTCSDKGRGMRPEHIAAVGAYMQFERKFYEQQGSGLGLIIAKRLAELNDGSLSISSEFGSGTEVQVKLPVPPSVSDGQPAL